ncbi:hypothetical protein [Streptomyces sp. SYSU K217416]
MLLRLAYLGRANAFALLRLLPMSDREKDARPFAWSGFDESSSFGRRVGEPTSNPVGVSWPHG